MIYAVYPRLERRGVGAYGEAETINQENTIVCARTRKEEWEVASRRTAGVTDSL